MLHARLEIAQILNVFQVRCVITEFSPGTDPTFINSAPLTLELPDEEMDRDVLSITLDLIRLWSEMTISE